MKPSSRAAKGGSGRTHSRTGRVVPVPTPVLPLSEGWGFCADPGAEAEGWARAGFDDRTWEGAVIPHTWNAHPAHVDDEGFAWYRRRFTVPIAIALFCAQKTFIQGIKLTGSKE